MPERHPCHGLHPLPESARTHRRPALPGHAAAGHRRHPQGSQARRLCRQRGRYRPCAAHGVRESGDAAGQPGSGARPGLGVSRHPGRHRRRARGRRHPAVGKHGAVRRPSARSSHGALLDRRPVAGGDAGSGRQVRHQCQAARGRAAGGGIDPGGAAGAAGRARAGVAHARGTGGAWTGFSAGGQAGARTRQPGRHPGRRPCGVHGDGGRAGRVRALRR